MSDSSTRENKLISGPAVNPSTPANEVEPLPNALDFFGKIFDLPPDEPILQEIDGDSGSFDVAKLLAVWPSPLAKVYKFPIKKVTWKPRGVGLGGCPCAECQAAYQNTRLHNVEPVVPAPIYLDVDLPEDDMKSGKSVESKLTKVERDNVWSDPSAALDLALALPADKEVRMIFKTREAAEAYRFRLYGERNRARALMRETADDSKSDWEKFVFRLGSDSKNGYVLTIRRANTADDMPKVVEIGEI